MKQLFTMAIFMFSVIITIGQTINPNYEPALAQALGADDYGMKSYILVILKTGTNKTADKAVIDSCFRGHLNNIGRLAEANKLIVAGPIGKNEKSYRGIFILNVTTIEEANELLQTDPAIRENLLEAELYKWYGSAALPAYLEVSEKIWKAKPELNRQKYAAVENTPVFVSWLIPPCVSTIFPDRQS